MRHPALALSARRRAGGSTLVVAVFVVAILATFIGLAVDYTANTARIMRRSRDYTNAQALASGAIEIIYKRWQQYLATHQASTMANDKTAMTLGNYTSYQSLQNALLTAPVLATLQAAAAANGFTVSQPTITPIDRLDNPIMCHYYYGVQNSTTVPGSCSKGPLQNVPGWVATLWNYRVRVTITSANDPTLSVTTSRYFQQADASLFQAMLFFQNDLELHPGPAMTLYGLVHTNANMYAVSGNGGSLTFNSSVSYHGSSATLSPATSHPSNFYENPLGYVEGVTQTLYNQESGNWATYKNPTYNTSMTSQLSNVPSLDPLGTQPNPSDYPGNNNATGTHEIIERPVPTSATNPTANPSVTDPDAFAAHRIFNSAGLRIIINRNDTKQPVHVYAPVSQTNLESSTEIVPTKSTDPAKQNIADQITAAVTVDTTGSIYDFREGRTINADTVDMSVLTPALNAYAAYNGVVYITDATNADAYGNTGNSDAIRLKKGGSLPGTVNGTVNASKVEGLTIATDGAIYVQGDYNTGTTYPTTGADLPNNGVVTASQPASNLNVDPTQYAVSGYTPKPAAVMGDAVMILSNAWKDSVSTLDSSKTNPTVNVGRYATPTTMNSAIVSGQVLTNAIDPATGLPNGKGSGGAHNFPRFLEDWTGDNFTYHGSMCELYASAHFTGTYGKTNVYSPPNRRWFFDDNFLSAPPPGNLRSTTYARGRWVRESVLQ